MLNEIRSDTPPPPPDGACMLERLAVYRSGFTRCPLLFRRT